MMGHSPQDVVDRTVASCEVAVQSRATSHSKRHRRRAQASLKFQWVARLVRNSLNNELWNGAYQNDRLRTERLQWSLGAMAESGRKQSVSFLA